MASKPRATKKTDTWPQPTEKQLAQLNALDGREPDTADIPESPNLLSGNIKRPNKDQSSPKPIETTRGHSNSMSLIEYTTDLNNAEAPVPLPEGQYTGTIEGAERKTSPKGNDYLALTIRIDPSEYPPDYTDGPDEGVLLTYNRVQINNSVQAKWKMRKLCEACGVRLGSTVDVNEFVGKGVSVAVSVGEWEGEKRAEVKKILEP